MEYQGKPALPPPSLSTGFLGWCRKNLFSTPLDIILSLSVVYLLYVALPPILQWVFFDAQFTGTEPEACQRDGACWVFIKERFGQFMYGFYPSEERWRINTIYVIAFVAMVFLIKPTTRKNIKIVIGCLMFTLFPLLAYCLFIGDVFGLPYVETAKWGGLHVTLVVAFSGILLSLPIGTLLALGRRSDMRVVRWFSIAFIELWRGVPLISVLFMSSVMLPLFLPDWIIVDKLLRALIGVTLFFSAYMAEVVRGGLQAIDKGQYEAAHALGFTYWQSMMLIILPQSLRIVIPGIVNTFIALFKDTTLILIIGLYDLLGIVQAANTDPQWIAFSVEGYVFAGFVFWIFCFGMSRYSQLLEHRLGKGRK